MKLHNKTNRGFTLIELLVVIAIIAILATLAAPAILNQLKKAKIVKSSGVCTAFETAVNNFESEYNYLPYSGASSPDADRDLRSDDDVMSVLAGVEDSVNFKKIKFFTLGEPKGSSESNYKDGMYVSSTAAKLYDPWGEPYYITLDYNMNGQVAHPYKGGGDESDDAIRKKAICWSSGPDKEHGDTKKNRDNPSNFD